MSPGFSFLGFRQGGELEPPAPSLGRGVKVCPVAERFLVGNRGNESADDVCPFSSLELIGYGPFGIDPCDIRRAVH